MSISKLNLVNQINGYFVGAKATIEALTGVAEGALGYATDTNEPGSYDGAAWAWGSGAGAVSSVNGQTGVVSLDSDDISEGGSNKYVTGTNLWAVITGSGSATPADGDYIGFVQTVGGNFRKTLFSTFRDSYLRANLDTVYALTAKGVTNGDSHDHNGGDGAQINHTNLSNIGSRTHAVIDDFISSGWVAISATWTRTGNHTFTAAGDVTATYSKGTKIRYKDGGSYEYGVIASSSHSAGTTTITLIPNTDYAMAAGTITDTYLSYVASPEGFPRKFNFTPTVTGSTGGAFGVAPTINSAFWCIQGNFGFFAFDITINAIGTATGTLQVTTPWTATNGAGSGRENAVTGNMLQTQVSSTTVQLFTYNNGAVLTATYRPVCGVSIDLA